MVGTKHEMKFLPVKRVTHYCIFDLILKGTVHFCSASFQVFAAVYLRNSIFLAVKTHHWVISSEHFKAVYWSDLQVDGHFDSKDKFTTVS